MNNTYYMTTSDGVSPLTWPVAQVSGCYLRLI